MARRKSSPPPGDPEPGEGVAHDGSPDPDELERRRQARGTSASARAEDDGSGATADGGELFPAGSLEGDSKVTIKNLIKSGARITVKASLSSAEVPLTTGLLDPEREVTLLVRGLPGGPVPVAKHRDAQAGGDHTIEEWTLRQPIRAIHVQDAGDVYTLEQVLEFMHAAGVESDTVSRVLGIPAAAEG